MNIQIASIGGQVLPVLQGIAEYPCDLVILFHTSESKTIAENIAQTMVSDFNLVEVPEANEFFPILQSCNEIYSKHPGASWWVNASSGTKIMSLALYSYFKGQEGTRNIFHIDQNGLVHSLIREENEPLFNFLPVKTYFDYSGQKIKSMTYFDVIDEDLFEIKNTVKNFHERNDQEFLQLNKLYSAQFSRTSHNFANFKIINPRSDSTAVWNDEKSELVLTLFRKYKDQPDIYSFYSREGIGIVFESKWFELEIAEILAAWPKTRELVWSLIVPYKDGQDKNEIDLIVNTGTKLLFVECKIQISDIKDIDKFRNVTKNYGGLGAKSILITYSKPPVRFFEKCSDNNILLFHFREANQLVNCVKDLYLLLNQEIIKSNTV